MAPCRQLDGVSVARIFVPPPNDNLTPNYPAIPIEEARVLDLFGIDSSNPITENPEGYHNDVSCNKMGYRNWFYDSMSECTKNIQKQGSIDPKKNYFKQASILKEDSFNHLNQKVKPVDIFDDTYEGGLTINYNKPRVILPTTIADFSQTELIDKKASVSPAKNLKPFKLSNYYQKNSNFNNEENPFTIKKVGIPQNDPELSIISESGKAKSRNSENLNPVTHLDNPWRHINAKNNHKKSPMNFKEMRIANIARIEKSFFMSRNSQIESSLHKKTQPVADHQFRDLAKRIVKVILPQIRNSIFMANTLLNDSFLNGKCDTSIKAEYPREKTHDSRCSITESRSLSKTRPRFRTQTFNVHVNTSLLSSARRNSTATNQLCIISKKCDLNISNDFNRTQESVSRIVPFVAEKVTYKKLRNLKLKVLESEESLFTKTKTANVVTISPSAIPECPHSKKGSSFRQFILKNKKRFKASP
jgi:hypothetical protein